MGCYFSKDRKINLENGIFKGIFKVLPEGKILINGKYNYKNKDEYYGNFINNQYEGKGQITTKKFVYNGDFEKNLIHGKGILYTNDYSYKGEFFKSKMNGIGSLKTNNYEYVGEFSNNYIQGYGKLFYKNLIIYEGCWYKNKALNGNFFLGDTYYSINFTNKLKIHKNEILQNIQNFKINIINYDYSKPIL